VTTPEQSPPPEPPRTRLSIPARIGLAIVGFFGFFVVVAVAASAAARGSGRQVGITLLLEGVFFIGACIWVWRSTTADGRRVLAPMAVGFAAGLVVFGGCIAVLAKL